MAATRTKAAYANVDGTLKGYRATVKTASGKVLASTHFDAPYDPATFTRDCDTAYANMKKWLAAFGVS
jgi:hypothetical protein